MRWTWLVAVLMLAGCADHTAPVATPTPPVVEVGPVDGPTTIMSAAARKKPNRVAIVAASPVPR